MPSSYRSKKRNLNRDGPADFNPCGTVSFHVPSFSEMTSKQCIVILSALDEARAAFGPDTDEIDIEFETALHRLVKLRLYVVKLKLKAEKRERKANRKH